MTLTDCLIFSAALFAVGLYGALTRRHLVGLLISIEIMLNAANINFIAFAYFRAADPVSGPVFVTFSIAVTACEMAAALAILVAMHRRRRSLDTDDLRQIHD